MESCKNSDYIEDIPPLGTDDFVVTAQMIADAQMELGCSRLVVEVGSEGIPVAFCANRGIREGEYYVSANVLWTSDSRHAAAFELKEYGEAERFKPILANARRLPFADGTVDELIFNNVFGTYSQEPDTMAIFFKEASRVLADSGEIHITEMSTPNVIPDKWFVSGRPDRDSEKEVGANPEYFQQFGLRVKKLSTDEYDIKEYRMPFPGENGFYPDAFTLVLGKA